jgi:luciferase family oxidoreductase group 1
MTIRLSILDQSIVRRNGTPREALEETIATAKLAERLGYTRFWVSEHHNSAMIAGSAPEVLMVRLASETSNIRIGSGGIMLPNHSALKVAENFRLLETLYPGRIDLGMGRAPGGDRITAALLNPSNNFAEEAYLQQLEHLQAFFTDKAATQYGPILAVPQSETQPLQWILSSSGGSSAIAARFGTGLAVAKFINGAVGPDVVNSYRKQFEPSENFSSPAELVAIQVICAETEEKATELRKMSDYVLLQFEKGIFGPLPDPSEVAAHAFSEYELERIRFNSGRIISGSGASVKKQVEALAHEFDVQEIMASCMTAEPAYRKRSFELLAELFL